MEKEKQRKKKLIMSKKDLNISIVIITSGVILIVVGSILQLIFGEYLFYEDPDSLEFWWDPHSPPVLTIWLQIALWVFGGFMTICGIYSIYRNYV